MIFSAMSQQPQRASWIGRLVNEYSLSGTFIVVVLVVVMGFEFLHNNDENGVTKRLLDLLPEKCRCECEPGEAVMYFTCTCPCGGTAAYGTKKQFQTFAKLGIQDYKEIEQGVRRLKLNCGCRFQSKKHKFKYCHCDDPRTNTTVGWARGSPEVIASLHKLL